MCVGHDSSCGENPWPTPSLKTQKRLAVLTAGLMPAGGRLPNANVRTATTSWSNHDADAGNDSALTGAARQSLGAALRVRKMHPTADDPREANFRTKHRSEINDLQRPKNDLQKCSLSLVRVNEVTYKLTDGKMSRTPASHGQWRGYDTERAVAWVWNLGWPFGRNDWYAFCGDEKIGPTDFNSAVAAARALANGVQGQPSPKRPEDRS